MDDDGRPYNSETIQELIKMKERLNLDYKKPAILNSLVVESDNKLSFAIKKTNDRLEITKIALNGIIEKEINPFNGTMISRGLIQDIGYPNKDFFIKGDEVDYMHRANKSGAFVATVIDSLYYHPSVKTTKQFIIGKKHINLYIEKPWKEYYNMRNYTYMLNKENKHKEIFVLGFKRCISTLICKCEKIKTLKMILKGYIDGKRGILGATIKP